MRVRPKSGKFKISCPREGRAFWLLFGKTKSNYTALKRGTFRRKADKKWRWGDLHPRPNTVKSRLYTFSCGCQQNPWPAAAGVLCVSL